MLRISNLLTVVSLLLVGASAFAGHAGHRHPGHRHPGHPHKPPVYRPQQTCAVAYEGAHYSGAQMTIPSGSRIGALATVSMYHYSRYSSPTWNNQISSLWVQPGCYLVGYQYDNFGIHYYTGQAIGMSQAYNNGSCHYASGQYPTLGHMDELISSLICRCN